MAFLDNSGDIILDAVLTETGRRRMAEGTFRISKFALGDDEINYAQYELNHPSGSAYEDLEILQTPILEGVTGEASAINYGLLSLTRLNILYLPSLKINTGMSTTEAAQMSGNVFYLAVNGETEQRLTDLSTTYPLGTNGEMLMRANDMGSRKIYIESGIDTIDEPADAAHRQSLINSVGMLDQVFTVSVDRRIFGQMLQLQAGQTFSAGTDSTSAAIIAKDMETSTGMDRRTRGLRRYGDYSIRGLDNLLYAPADPTVRSDPSVLLGPRGSAMAMNFKVWSSMKVQSSAGTPDKFTKLGKTSQVVFADSGYTDKYDYIDTTVYVRGNSSTAAVQVPIRVIRFSGA